MFRQNESLFEIIQRYGFHTPLSAIASSMEEAVALASKIGLPVALKIVSPDILHKTDVGGIALGLNSPQEVRQAYQNIQEAVHRIRPLARIQGVEVQEMVKGGVEIILGLLDDPQFGLAILFGLGGIYTEVLNDISFRILPIDRRDAFQMIQETHAARLLHGFRGHPPVSQALLVDLLLNLCSLGMDLAGQLEAVDLNPVLVWEDQHRVLDAKLIWQLQPRVLPEVPQANPTHLDKFFKASSVAVIGASPTPGKIGHALIESVRCEYRGRVYPVNPTRTEILGLPCYPSLSKLPEPPDLAILATDLRLAPGLIEECGRMSVHNLVIISGGGKELGGDRASLESEIRRQAQANDVRVIGPNCIGTFDGATRLQTFFQPYERMQRPKAGQVAMLTQSGTVGGLFLEDASSLGVSKLVSYGNRSDVDEADLLVYLADDLETSVIALYVEGFEQGRKFLETAKAVARKKPVVIYKAGRTDRGARASLSHTGFFGGSYTVVKGALHQAGLIVVDSYEELLAAVKALAMQPAARGNRVGLVSSGAGVMVQALDLLESAGLEAGALSPGTFHKLKEVYPEFYLVQNPLDITGSATSDDFETGIQALLDDPQIDLIMPWLIFLNAPLQPDMVEKLARLNRASGKPILVGTSRGPFSKELAKAIEDTGVPVFHTVGEWVAAARAITWRSWLDLSQTESVNLSHDKEVSSR